ncbi:S9 family peptidase [Asanoa iriomotensis]|uniref:Dipeptidyl-peptidase 4 n=1 Tax=Asanoa iriomotensis TaxID=234613 RepID=A0ABQ4CAJ4_9ACTN|nr:prolyl oligopeptidase family serine peptidase [Asanoa iriomotensis]GIF59812.1 dipeptidyl-peptidase 4 [Asanoa iriomotensis]
MEFPELAARTHLFTRGAPHEVTVAADGSRALFLRSAGPEDPTDSLWALDLPAGGEATERLVAEGPIDAYAADPLARVAALVTDGRLRTVDVRTGAVTEVTTDGPVTDARPDPTGTRIAYLSPSGELRVINPGGADVLLAGEGTHVSWGRAEEVAARDFDRRRGYWWSPDGQTLLATRVDDARVARTEIGEPPVTVARPRAGGTNAEVSLHLLDLDGGWVDVHWDRETYPYLVAVDWVEGGPLITVLRRMQQHGLVLAVDPRTGETQVHAELADPRWVEPVAGTPCHLPDGRVLVGGELAHDGYDARCLFADGTLLTPPSLYLRRVVGRMPGPGGSPDLLVEASDGEPSEQHLFRVRTAIGGGGVESRRLTTAPGWHTGAVGGDVLVIGARSLDHTGTRWTIWQGDTQVAKLELKSAEPPVTPRPTLERVTDRRLPAAVVYPAGHVAGRRLPVLLDIDGGPGRQEVRAERSAWIERQWWADNGFAVVTVDNRGTPGVAPSFEKVVHRRLADVMLSDQADALAALSGKHPDLDLARVAVRGRRFGGWLAALAVLRRPETFRSAVAEGPIVDWAQCGTAYAERYLGQPVDGPEIYAHHSLLELAAEPVPPRSTVRPLLIVADPADLEEAAEVARLSTELTRTNRPHELLRETDPARRLPAELDFLRRSV